MPVIGRLAPSPTGPLHLGHAYAFVLAWCKARSQGGRVILRFDDLDHERAHDKFVSLALSDLEWLGLDWDGPPVFESSRKALLRERALELMDRGLAYPCVCTRSELVDVSAPHGAEARYSGVCRGRFASIEAATRATGRSAALRLATSSEAVHFTDENFGALTIDVHASVGDFPILRRDGTPAYQLAVVVDDALDRVTEVVRGRDLLESTPRQILLERALGLSHRATFHVPLICNEQGKRLAKRDHARSLIELRNAGVDPRSIVGWIASAAGQIDGAAEPERISVGELLASFSAASIGTTDVRAPIHL